VDVIVTQTGPGGERRSDKPAKAALTRRAGAQCCASREFVADLCGSCGLGSLPELRPAAELTEHRVLGWLPDDDWNSKAGMLASPDIAIGNPEEEVSQPAAWKVKSVLHEISLAWPTSEITTKL
jgi:hypothetical protein